MSSRNIKRKKSIESSTPRRKSWFGLNDKKTSSPFTQHTKDTTIESSSSDSDFDSDSEENLLTLT